jgi:hypothetical protein
MVWVHLPECIIHAHNVEVTCGALGLQGESPGDSDSSSMYKMNLGKNLDPCNEIRATY